MEASALHAPAGLTRGRISIPSPLLRLRSDEQLVALFRAGEEEAFRIIHDRYNARLLAYTRQMLANRQDAEDILQEVFVRAYAGLRASDRPLALRAWLYRIAHNGCVDQLRRPVPPPPEALGATLAPAPDPVARAEERESLRRLVADLRRLPEQQRSALLMRELGGISYDELALALGISVAAVKSVLVRARVSLAQAIEARDTACPTIREELILAHDGRRRPHALARRHLRDCDGCRGFRREVRGVSRELAALAPALGPVAAVAKVLGVGGGSAAAGGGSAAAGSGLLAGTSVLTGGLGHVVTVLAAAAVTAGGAVEIQSSLTPADPPTHHTSAANVATSTPASAVPVSAVQTVAAVVADGTTNVAAQPTKSSANARMHASASSTGGATSNTTSSGTSGGATSSTSSHSTKAPVDDSALDPSMGPGVSGSSSESGNSTGTSPGGSSSTDTSSGTGASDTSGNAGSPTTAGGPTASTSGTGGTGSAGSAGSGSANAASGATTPSSGSSGTTNNGTITSSGSGSGSTSGTATLGVLKAGS